MVVVILDFETSGLNPYHDDIIEIGTKVLNSENSFTCLVKPKSNRPISQKITDITGIRNSDLRTGGKPWYIAYVEFYNWLYESYQVDDSLTIVSHNGDSFDFVFLKRLLKELLEKGEKNNMDFSKITWIDTLPLCKRLLPGRSYYNQPSLARTFQVHIDCAHRAMGDVIVLEQVYNHLMEELSKTKIDNILDPINIRKYIDLKL